MLKVMISGDGEFLSDENPSKQLNASRFSIFLILRSSDPRIEASSI